jgi:DNA polymerase-1
MEQKGVLIDVSRIKEMEGEYQKKIDAVNIKLSRSVKRDYFNVASNPQVQAVLFGDEPGCLKLRSNKKTKTGKWSTDKDSFEYMKRKYARKKRVITVLSMIQEVRRMRKMKSTYLTGFIKLVDELNRIHTSYLSTGTVTGRLASEGPNLQNIPKDPIFRSLFIAGPGRKLIAADYSQIEARLLAWLAVELDLIQLFADTNFDPHYYNSSIFRQKPISEVTKEERSIDKAVTFGINYGRSAKSIADEYELDLDFVKGHIAQFFQTFRKIKAWRNRQITVSKKQGWIENKSGTSNQLSNSIVRVGPAYAIY